MANGGAVITMVNQGNGDTGSEPCYCHNSRAHREATNERKLTQRELRTLKKQLPSAKRRTQSSCWTTIKKLQRHAKLRGR